MLVHAATKLTWGLHSQPFNPSKFEKNCCQADFSSLLNALQASWGVSISDASGAFILAADWWQVVQQTRDGKEPSMATCSVCRWSSNSGHPIKYVVTSTFFAFIQTIFTPYIEQTFFQYLSVLSMFAVFHVLEMTRNDIRYTGWYFHDQARCFSVHVPEMCDVITPFLFFNLHLCFAFLIAAILLSQQTRSANSRTATSKSSQDRIRQNHPSSCHRRFWAFPRTVSTTAIKKK